MQAMRAAATRLEAGSPGPLGAHFNGHGINFAVYSGIAEQVELCLFDARGEQELQRLPLPSCSGAVWHGFLADAKPGTVYGYRVHGPYLPEHGQRCNPHKLLFDPLARALVGRLVWDDAVFGYQREHPHGTRSFDTRDSAPFVPKAQVVAAPTPWPRPPKPRIPWNDSVLYELHVKGFTRRHPAVPEGLRGTIFALGEQAVIDYLRELGVTTLQLMPILAFADEEALVRQGLTNYWGYNPLGFTALHPPYLGGGQLAGVARVIDRLHAAGLEVILDVVFNHTAETDARGPTLSLRGLDNAAYYRLRADAPDEYVDASGCGNTLNCAHPAVVRALLASLRYLANELGVDGFRFDLASILGFDVRGEFHADAPLLAAIRADPELAQLKLLAEPWSVQDYRLGAFPRPFAELNDRYREALPRFWLGEAGSRGEWATRLAGSSDIFQAGGRGPAASVNYLASHDGLTLADRAALLARRHGSHDEDTTPLQRRLQRTGLAALLLSRGVPLLQAGDELSRSQAGDANAYCQDGPRSWLDWQAQDDAQRDLRGFWRQALGLRRALACLRQNAFYRGGDLATSDLIWLNADAEPLHGDDWHRPEPQPLAALIRDAGETLWLAFNPLPTTLRFRLPEAEAREWMVLLDSDAAGDAPARLVDPGDTIQLAGFGVLVCAPSEDSRFGVDDSLRRRAEALGILTAYLDTEGERRLVPASTLRTLVRGLHPGVKLGSARPPHGPPAPSTCWLPPALRDGRGVWALAIEPYALRGANDWGIGDYTLLGEFGAVAAELGAAAVLLTPLHAPSLTRPQLASPYSPSSRLALNPLLLDVDAIAATDAPVPAYQAWRQRPAVRAQLQRLRESERIDYPAVARIKLHALGLLYEAFAERHLGAQPSAQGEVFRRFQRKHAARLHGYARFEAIAEHLACQHGQPRVPSQWPAELASAAAPGVDAFVQRHAARIEFFEYLQWQADQQWLAATRRARAAGLGIGFITDLAVGADRDGAEVWQQPDAFFLDAELGAPPDAFAPQGQRWGCPPWHPQRLLASRLAPLREVLRVVMRGAGALRIDHILGWQRQFWVPAGAPASQGGYVRFPFDAMLALAARESRHRHCVVIGEDLGNVPEGLRERMHAAQILGMRLMIFERDDAGRLRAPEAFDPLALAAFGSHDLPSIPGILQGSDVDARAELGLYADADAERRARQERAALLAEFGRTLDCPADPTHADAFTRAVHRRLAKCASRLAVVRMDDVLGMLDAANLPGAAEGERSWRRRLPLGVSALREDPRLRDTAALFATRRT